MEKGVPVQAPPPKKKGERKEPGPKGPPSPVCWDQRRAGRRNRPCRGGGAALPAGGGRVPGRGESHKNDDDDDDDDDGSIWI